MKLYEYEGKKIFSIVGIPIPKGQVVYSPVNVPGKVVVKAQLLEGGRGKRGLVRVTEDSFSTISDMMKEGISTFLIEEFVSHDREIYISAMMDRESGNPMIIISPNGGINIEESKDVRTFVIPLDRTLMRYDVDAMEKYVGYRGLTPIVQGLLKLLLEYDAELAEINPLAITERGALALDSKVILDDNALFRHEELLNELRREKPASDSYVELDGDIGIIGNGAGLTMATMDLVKLMGGNPADFFDVGGGADMQKVAFAIERVGTNPRVKKIVINIFGGITRCDEVAKGILDGHSKVNKPIYVRLTGTKEDEGKEILTKAGIKVYEDALSAIGDALR
ncbi:succinate--CoA ligase subunit beta [Metallosphaera cuprina]|uniref:Succinyl-CoA synthetase (ADP-forming) beta subunit n=1 Tax=Metallosphaera cuprina (strain Ar-4) TaxID=1006006 RepID=F4G1E2_METCR|nr:succinate--CoA ligase subunit beta [Metallosphaera cuprina]AEB94755.1 succinyl-CoA synthetase (ADP-forming) beta subunit [Metallosphaera cuprina Ar-4]